MDELRRRQLGVVVSFGVSIEKAEKFIEWYEQNLWVWEAFEALCLETYEKGVRRWGAKGAAEVLRWKCNTDEPFRIRFKAKKDYKINNSWVSILARLFLWKHRAQVGDFFETREGREAALDGLED